MRLIFASQTFSVLKANGGCLGTRRDEGRGVAAISFGEVCSNL